MNIRTNTVGDPFGGSVLREGTRGNDVAKLQTRLSLLSRYYAPIYNLPVDGLFGHRTAESVRAFQALFGLRTDGAVNEGCWAAIASCYRSAMEGTPAKATPAPLQVPLSKGDTGSTVKVVQFLLLAAARVVPLPVPKCDGIYGYDTKTAVIGFQAQAKLPETGITDSETFAALLGVYQTGQLVEKAKPAPANAFQVIRMNSESTSHLDERTVKEAILQAVTPTLVKEEPAQTHDAKAEEADVKAAAASSPSVVLSDAHDKEETSMTPVISATATSSSTLDVQKKINLSVPCYTPLLSTVTEDGILGPKTTAQIVMVQQLFGLPADGVAGSKTMAALNAAADGCSNSAPIPFAPAYPGTLRQGSTGNAVKLVQFMLGSAKWFYSTLPSVTIDGVYGTTTTKAVTMLQSLTGLSADGVVGSKTYALLYALYRAFFYGISEPAFVDYYAGTTLSQGSTGAQVIKLQTWLNTIASCYPTLLPTLTPDGKYGSKTAANVSLCQTMLGLVSDGSVGSVSWSAFWQKQASCAVAVPGLLTPRFPESAQNTGTTGNPVKITQYLHNQAKLKHPTLPTLTIDGVYGSGTKAGITQFQALETLVPDGITGFTTFTTLLSVYRQVSVTSPSPYKSSPMGRDTSTDTPSVPMEQEMPEQAEQEGHEEPEGSWEQENPVEFAEQGEQEERPEIMERAVNQPSPAPEEATPEETMPQMPTPMEQMKQIDQMNQADQISWRFGQKSNDVKALQANLNLLGDSYPALPHVAEDGLYGSATTKAVSIFQQMFGLKADGIYGPATKAKILDVVQHLQTGWLTPIEKNGIRIPLQQGDISSSVKIVQSIWITLRQRYTTLPVLTVDGIFGSGTANAVRQMQAIASLKADGVIGQKTMDTVYPIYRQIIGR